MAEERPKIRWHTICLAACWTVFLVGTAIVTPKFSRMFREIGGGAALPTFTRMFLSIPASLWIVLGFLVGAGVIVKSKLISAITSEVVDMISWFALLAAVMAEVIALYMPLTGPLRAF